MPFDRQLESKHIKEHYDLTTGVCNTIKLMIDTDIQRSYFSYSIKSVHYATRKLDSLLKALLAFDRNDFDTYYIMYLYFRPAIEIFFINYYITTRCRIEMTDAVGREWNQQRFDSEFIKRINFDLKHKAILDNVPKKDLSEFIKNRFGTEIDGAKLTEIHTNAGQFEFEKIIKYLNHKIPDDDPQKDFNRSISLMFYFYNVASNYIHGGLLSDVHHYEIDDKAAKERNLQFMIDTVRKYSMMLKEMVLGLLSFQFPEYKKFFVLFAKCNAYHDSFDNDMPKAEIDAIIEKAFS